MDLIKKENYDNFLLNNKNGRIKRIGIYTSRNKNIEHECQDQECKRIWKPKPIQMLDDDYYCPSCVLHHRNNMDRFKLDRLLWTKYIPNTFYVFTIVDPNYPNLELAKFGRTQNNDSLKRYPNSELRDYKMDLICELRGNLITMTRIENFWKKKATQLNIYHNFSIDTFHGKSECILSKDYLDNLLIATLCIFEDNSDNPDNDGFEFDF
jgi:hypothetical protein